MSLYETLNTEQQQVFDRLKDGESIFITGNAGTGKSYLVKAFDEYCQNKKIKLVKTAPTGVAANEIGGATLHHQFKLKVGLDFDIPNTYPKFLDKTDVLLIDEISMVRIDIFDKLMQILTLANEKRTKKKKKIQLILCGDFYQLAPVINSEERPHINEYYGCDIKEGYCFQSKYWRMYGVQLVNLTTVIRQSDAEFCKALDLCKTGNPDCISYISDNKALSPDKDAVWLCGKNKTADEKNEEGLQRLKGTEYNVQAEYEGDVTKKDRLCDDNFTFKIGAKVIMLVNHSKGYYQNGTVAFITGIEYGDTGIQTISVKVPDGRIVEVERQEFSKYEYAIETVENPKTDNEGNIIRKEDGTPEKRRTKQLIQKKTGSAKQFPMRLGYAVTIHKSQGQTYDAMNLIPEIFATGQLYVALSRCKTIENIYIYGELKKYMVKTSKEVIEFYSDPENYTFFNKDEAVKPVFVPMKYLKEVEQFLNELAERDKKSSPEPETNPFRKFKKNAASNDEKDTADVPF